MNVTVNTQQLATELRLLCKVAPDKPTIPVLGNVLFDAQDGLRLTATDLEIGLSTQCLARIAQPGQMTLPAKKLLEMVEQLPNGDMVIAKEGPHARVTSGRFTSRLTTQIAEDFPLSPNPPNGDGLQLQARSLQALIRCTRYAISEKTTKYILNGALLSFAGEAMAMVATDGKRLSVASAVCQAGAEASVVLPTKTLDSLLALDLSGEVGFVQSSQHLFFHSNGRLLISRTIDGQFPNWQRIIPQDQSNTARIDRLPLAAALRRVGVVAEQDQAVKFAFGANQLLLTSRSFSFGEAEETLAIAYDGPEMALTINGQALLDFLEVAEGQTITIALKDSKTPLLVSDGDFINVILLMRG